MIGGPGAEEAVVGAVPVGGGELSAAHPLRYRLVATELTNRFVDWMGSSAHPRLMRETGRQGWEIARAWYVACCVGEVPSIRDSLVSMEDKVPAGVLYEWYSSIAGVLERSVRWLLANADPEWSSAETISALVLPASVMSVPGVACGAICRTVSTIVSTGVQTTINCEPATPLARSVVV